MGNGIKGRSTPLGKASLAQEVRVKERSVAVRPSVGVTTGELRLRASTVAFKSEVDTDDNYDAVHGYDKGVRHNVSIYPDTNPVWVRFFSDEQEQPTYLYLPEDVWFHSFNMECTDIGISSAEATAQSQVITAIADTGVKAVKTFTLEATADADAGDYGVFYDATGAAWAFSMDVAGTDPEPTGAGWEAVAASNKVHVDISGGTDAESVCDLVRTALNALTGFSDKFTTSGTNTLVITCDQVGPVTAASVSNADDSDVGDITVAQTTTGVASNLNNKYFYMYARNNTTGTETVIGVWLNVNGEGTEPVDSLVDQWEDVAITAGSTNSTVATAVEAVIEAIAISAGDVFDSSAAGAAITVVHDTAGGYGGSQRIAGDPSSNGSGFTFAAATAGGAATSVTVFLV